MMTKGKRIYVLDTNVLMHDPTALFKFEEHDVYLPMQVIEELDNAKKGTSEASRNARQVSRFLNELIYLIQTKGFVPGRARIRVEEEEGGYRLIATLFGEPFQEGLGFQGEVKSATFHGLSVRKEDDRWKAQVILDV